MEVLQTHVIPQYSRRSFDSAQVEYKKGKPDTKFYQPVIRKSERVSVRPKKLKFDSSDSESQADVQILSEHTLRPPGTTFALDPMVIDSGGHTIKMGYSCDDQPKIIPNAIMKVKSEKKRLFIGNQIDECRDLSGLYFLLPCERGYITKWEVQKPIWDYAFNKGAAIEDRYVVMTQPIFNFKTIQDGLDELFFEDYEVKGMLRASPSDFSRYEYCTNVTKSESPCIVVDSGFSFSHIVPYIDGKKYYKGLQRVNVGGKFLTNYLRDIISYRMYDVMEETYVINQVKEDCIYLSMNVKEELRKSRLTQGKNAININYVLPDFNMIRRGYIQNMEEDDEIAENCQILRLNNERFTVPELLFYPKDVGLTSIGVAEAVAKAILKAPATVRNSLSQNIVLTGGNVRIPGFQERFEADVRTFLPANYIVKTYKPEDPVSFAWKGEKSILQDPQFKNMSVTKQEYEEHGSKITYERFNTWAHIPDEEPPKPTEITPVSYIDFLKKLNAKEEETPIVISPERPVYIEDPGEGPSTRPDPVLPAFDEEIESAAMSPEHSEDSDDASRCDSEKNSSIDKNNLENHKNTTNDFAVSDLDEDAEFDIVMEDMRSYI